VEPFAAERDREVDPTGEAFDAATVERSGLDDLDAHAPLSQQVCRRHPGGAGADDDHGQITAVARLAALRTIDRKARIVTASTDGTGDTQQRHHLQEVTSPHRPERRGRPTQAWSPTSGPVPLLVLPTCRPETERLDRGHGRLLVDVRGVTRHADGADHHAVPTNEDSPATGTIRPPDMTDRAVMNCGMTAAFSASSRPGIPMPSAPHALPMAMSERRNSAPSSRLSTTR
jgi:hypothetical protein